MNHLTPGPAPTGMAALRILAVLCSICLVVVYVVYSVTRQRDRPSPAPSAPAATAPADAASAPAPREHSVFVGSKSAAPAITPEALAPAVDGATTRRALMPGSKSERPFEQFPLLNSAPTTVEAQSPGTAQPTTQPSNHK